MKLCGKYACLLKYGKNDFEDDMHGTAGGIR